MRKIIWLGIVVLLVAAAWSAAWFYAAGEARHQVALLAANDGERAPQLTCAEFVVTGFPFRFDLACTNATLVSEDHTLTLAGLKASVLAYNPTHVIFSAQAPLTLDNAFTGSQSRIDFTGFEGSARVEAADLIKGFSGAGWRIGRISMVADGIVWNDTVSGDLLQASADHAEAHLIDIPEQHDKTAGTAALAAYAEVKNLNAPGYGIAAGDGSLEAELSGLPDDLRALVDPEPLRRWQQAGGKLKVVRLAGNQPSPETLFELTGEASLTDTGLVNADVQYRTKDIFERFAAYLPAWQVPLLEGKQETDGSYSNTLRMDKGQIKLLTFTLVNMPSVFD